MNTNNKEIRQAVISAGVKYCEVAKVLGVANNTLATWLSNDISEDKKNRILKAVKDATKNKINN